MNLRKLYTRVIFFSMVNTVLFGIPSESDSLAVKEEDLWSQESTNALVSISLNGKYVILLIWKNVYIFVI